MNFLIVGVIYFVCGTIIPYSEGGAIKIQSKQFSEFGSWTIRPADSFGKSELRKKRFLEKLFFHILEKCQATLLQAVSIATSVIVEI